MGQQQILFVILAVCIIAIAVSVGVLSLSGHAPSDNRTLLAQDLNMLAKRAQNYFALPIEQGGGDGSFIWLNRIPNALGHLGCPSSNAHGDFFVKKTSNSSNVQIVAVGIAPGHDQKHPLRLVITVWSDHTSLSELN